MKIKSLSWLLTVLTASLFLTSCATICGGSRYNAEVIVENHPKAEITYNDQYIGAGRAYVKIKRRNANNVNFIVKEEGKKEEFFSFNGRIFRGWSLLGTILGWTGVTTNGIYLPWGLAVDGITGSWWKPDENENGIVKVDFDNYRYFLKYKAEDDGSKPKQTDNTQQATPQNDSLESKLEQLNSLKERGVISDEEYNRMRENILNNF